MKIARVFIIGAALISHLSAANKINTDWLAETTTIDADFFAQKCHAPASADLFCVGDNVVMADGNGKFLRGYISKRENSALSVIYKNPMKPFVPQQKTPVFLKKYVYGPSVTFSMLLLLAKFDKGESIDSENNATIVNEAKVLIDRYGANVNETLENLGLSDDFKRTFGVDWTSNALLHFFTLQAEQKAIQFLLDNGANINIKNSVGYTPLRMAMNRYDLGEEVGDLLLNAGADPNIPDNEGVTPLLNCVGSDVKALNRLLLGGAQPNLADRQGTTPLLEAVLKFEQNEQSPNEFVKILLAGGADPDLADTAGRTPLKKAAMNGNTGVIDQLIWYGAQPFIEKVAIIFLNKAKVQEKLALATELFAKSEDELKDEVKQAVLNFDLDRLCYACGYLKKKDNWTNERLKTWLSTLAFPKNKTPILNYISKGAKEDTGGFETESKILLILQFLLDDIGGWKTDLIQAALNNMKVKSGNKKIREYLQSKLPAAGTE